MSAPKRPRGRPRKVLEGPPAPKRSAGRPRRVGPPPPKQRRPGSRELGLFANAIRDCLGLDPLYHDQNRPSDDEKTTLGRFYNVHEWKPLTPRRPCAI